MVNIDLRQISGYDLFTQPLGDAIRGDIKVFMKESPGAFRKSFFFYQTILDIPRDRGVSRRKREGIRAPRTDLFIQRAQRFREDYRAANPSFMDSTRGITATHIAE